MTPLFVPGAIYLSKTHGYVEYKGTDQYMGQTTFRFFSIQWNSNLYCLPEALSTHFDLVNDNKAANKFKQVDWRTFDGEGGYEFRDYDLNFDYKYDWDQRNPNHKGWVEPLYAQVSDAQKDLDENLET